MINSSSKRNTSKIPFLPNDDELRSDIQLTDRHREVSANILADSVHIVLKLSGARDDR